jgi:hypothetical protein
MSSVRDCPCRVGTPHASFFAQGPVGVENTPQEKLTARPRRLQSLRRLRVSRCPDARLLVEGRSKAHPGRSTGTSRPPAELCVDYDAGLLLSNSPAARRSQSPRRSHRRRSRREGRLHFRRLKVALLWQLPSQGERRRPSEEISLPICDAELLQSDELADGLDAFSTNLGAQAASERHKRTR